MHCPIGKKKPRWQHRKPAFYLFSATFFGGTWHLPLPVETLLAWLWQRWELEVAHREMKSGFGVGEKQCWNPLATITSIPWGCGSMRSYCGRPIAPGAYWVGHLFPPAGGPARNGGRSIRSGVNTAGPAGGLLNFKPFGPERPATGSKRSLPAGLVQCRCCFSPCLEQKGHSRTLFVCSWPRSTLLKKPKSREILPPLATSLSIYATITS